MKSLQNWKSVFIEQCSIMEQLVLHNDVKRHNQAMKVLQKIFREFEKQPEEAKETLKELLSYNNKTIQLNAAAHCIALNVNVTEAQAILSGMSKTSNDKHFSCDNYISFQAQSLLDVWHQNGYIKIYPDQKIYR